MYAGGKNDEASKIIRKVNDLEAKGKLKDAIKELQRLIKLNPDNGNSYNRLGDLYAKCNKSKDAIEVYQKGVDAFRKDGFSRNALALCKKILRHDSGNIDTNLVIAELLVDLDEKSDALIYYFSYIDKQLAEQKNKEVLKAIDAVRDLEIFNGKVVTRINDIYKKLGRNDLAKKFAEELLKEDTTVEDITILATPVATPKAKTGVKENKETPKPVPRQRVYEAPEKKQVNVQVDTSDLERAVDDIEIAVGQLRKAMRLDEVILALEKSLTSLSNEQKKAIALFQQSLHNNLDNLESLIKDFRESSGKNMQELTPLLKNLDKSLDTLDRNQTTFSKEVNENLQHLSKSFNVTTKAAADEIKKVMLDYKKATDDMCVKFEATKETNIKISKTNEEMKSTVQNMNDTMIKFIMTQESNQKKSRRFGLIMIIITGLISILLILQLFI
jgi:tetratricopeptide (TPR) repeat protein